MTRHRLSCMFILILGLLAITPSCKNENGPATQPVVDLIVAEVSTPPVIDGTGTDSAWDAATELLVTLGQAPEYTNDFGEINLSLKAVRTESDLYIRAEWVDPSGSYSVDRQQWTYAEGAGWSQTGDEDRLYLMFEARDNGAERADCATMCHASEGTMRTTGGGHVDVWSVNAASTLPVGCADDQWWDDSGPEGDDYTVDAFTENKEGSLPIYRGPVTDGHFIIVPAGLTASSYCTPYDPGNATSIPGLILNENKNGSRFADVEARSSFTNGVWVVEMRRAMDTGQDDDVAFAPSPGLLYQMTVAVTDDSRTRHSGSPPFNLIF